MARYRYALQGVSNLPEGSFKPPKTTDRLEWGTLMLSELNPAKSEKDCERARSDKILAFDVQVKTTEGLGKGRIELSDD